MTNPPLPSDSALIWRCRRGTLELDALLNCYREHAYAGLSDQDKQVFCALLDLPDEVLQAVFLEHARLDDEAMMACFSSIKTVYRAHGALQ